MHLHLRLGQKLTIIVIASIFAAVGNQTPTPIQPPFPVVPGSLASIAGVRSNTNTDNHIALGLFGFATLDGTRRIVRVLKSGCTGGTGPLGRRAPAVRRRGFRIPCICQDRLSICATIE